MPFDEPKNWMTVIERLLGPLGSTPLWVVTLALWATATGSIRRLKTGMVKRLTIWQVLKDTFISLPLGLLAYYITISHFGEEYIAAGVAVIIAHTGMAVFISIENAVKLKLEKWSNK